jgi:hypothetical protein
MGERSGSPVGVAAVWRTPPRQVPRIGQVLNLAEEDLRYRAAGLRLRVDRVRLDISGCYDGAWVWLEGQQLDGDDRPVAWQQALVAVTAVERAADSGALSGLR